MGRYDEDAYALAPVDSSERAAAALAHAGLFLGGPFLIPLAVWLIFPAIQPSAYVRHQAVQVLDPRKLLLLSTAELEDMMKAEPEA